MTVTLHGHMDSLFNTGLEIVRMHEQQIRHEWKSVIAHLQNAGKLSKKSTDKTIHIFSKYLFNFENNKESLLTSIKKSWEQEIKKTQTTQFIVTLLENAIHKVIHSTTNHSYKDHQAVTYLFTLINEHIIGYTDQEYFTIDTFLQHLVSSQQLPIEWAAIVNKREDSFIVEKWFSCNCQDSPLLNNSLKADTIYELTETLLTQVTNEHKRVQNVIPIPYGDHTLLFCTTSENTSYVIPFITYALQIYQSSINTLKATQQKQQWKDSVIMFNDLIMRSQSFHEAVENITAGFVHYLPFKRCALFSYSTNDQMGLGLFGYRLDNAAIQNITEDIRDLPFINNGLQLLRIFGEGVKFLQPIYIEDASLGFPEKYVQQFKLSSIIVAPIYTSNNRLLGAVLLDQGPGEKFSISKDTFTALIKFGQSAGEILTKFHKPNLKQHTNTVRLSPREIEVLKLMAEGESTTETAQKLHLSEYTVRDYVSTIMQKMNARNRTEAVAQAIRQGII